VQCVVRTVPREAVYVMYTESVKEKERLAASRFEGIVCAFRMFTTAVYKVVCIQLRFKDFPLYYVLLLLHIKTSDNFSQ